MIKIDKEVQKIVNEVQKIIDEVNEEKEEVFNPKPGDIVYVLGIDDNEKDFYGVMGLNVNDSIQVTKICDSQGNILSGDYRADKHQLYDGEGLKKLVSKLEANLETLKKYI